MFQAILVLLLTQRLGYALLESGDRGIGQLVEFGTKLIEEYTADFILSRGGWVRLS